MKIKIFFLTGLLLFFCVFKSNAQNYKFINGNWFNGTTFEKKTFYSVNGKFSDKEPELLTETINLKKRFVIPPFGEAHNHNVESDYDLQEIIEKYLSKGIFYVKNPNSITHFTNLIRRKLNRPETIDVTFSTGGLTSTDGHPITIYSRRMKFDLSWLGVKSLEDNAYYIIDNRKDLNKKWARIMAGKPDFIKVFLLFSEEFEKRSKDKNFYGKKGLNPKLLPAIVEKARKNGLRVSAHTETAYDFKIAVKAGIGEINHLPAHSTFFARNNIKIEDVEIKEEDAKLAAKKNVFVVPTYSLLLYAKREKNKERFKKIQEMQKRNLRLLHQSGVKITIGSDDLSKTSQKEALYLNSLKVFSNLELLKMWVENTPQTIFPNRKIGKLEKGYEASFIVLEKNPLNNFETVKKIKYRFKQGFPLD